MDGLLFREMRECDDDLLLFQELFASSPHPKSIEHLRWQYLQNPWGKLLVGLVEDQRARRLAASYAVVPVPVRLGDRRVLAGIAIDGMTSSEYRHRGLFVKLVKRTHARCEREGLAFVYGFPNENSSHGIFRSLGWTPPAPPMLMVRPFRLTSLVRRLLHLPRVPRAQSGMPARPMPSDFKPVEEPGVVSLPTFDDETDRLWTDFSRGFAVTVDRSHDYMNWRFVRKPEAKYFIRALKSGRDYEALIVYTMRDGPDMRIGNVMDLFFRAGGEAAGRVLLKIACQHLHRAGCGAATVVSFTHAPGYHLYARSGFLAIPPVKPYKMRWGFTPLELDAKPLLANAANWYLSYSDFDWV